MNSEEKKRLKTERKEFVKSQRAKFAKSPGDFIKEEIIEPTKEYWKKRPGHAIYTFFKWMVIYYLIFGIIQTIMYDSVYCDATQNQYDGKMLLVFNDFAKDYNKEALNVQSNPYYVTETYSGKYKEEKNSFGIETVLSPQEKGNIAFAKEWSINCTHNFKKWINEPIQEKKSIPIGLKKVLLKQK